MDKSYSVPTALVSCQLAAVGYKFPCADVGGATVEDLGV